MDNEGLFQVFHLALEALQDRIRAATCPDDLADVAWLIDGVGRALPGLPTGSQRSDLEGELRAIRGWLATRRSS